VDDESAETRKTYNALQYWGIDELAGLRELGVWMKEGLSEDVVVSVVSRKDVQGHGMDEAEEVL
jgi:hypothetical protein